MAGTWEYSEQDLNLGVEGYITHAVGVAIFNDPEATQPVHGRIPQTDATAIAVHAERLIHKGLHEVVTYANPPERRRRILDAEDYYAAAQAGMLAIRQTAFEDEEAANRLDTLNPLMRVLRPLAVLKEHIYKATCHSNLYRIPIHELMGGFMLADTFEAVIPRFRKLG